MRCLSINILSGTSVTTQKTLKIKKIYSEKPSYILYISAHLKHSNQSTLGFRPAKAFKDNLWEKIWLSCVKPRQWENSEVTA